MSFPADIVLPALSAKYFSFRNNTNKYNSNHDITWSFSYQITNPQNAQYGICTFLTTLSSTPLSALPGQYLGTYIPNNLVSVAFDTTGLFALSSTIRPGVNINQRKLNSLVVRNSANNVIYNQSLSSTGFAFSGAQIIRCRLSNASQTLYVDYRPSTVREFISLAVIPIDVNITNTSNIDNVHVGFTFCSPISTTLSSTATMTVYNLHTEGVQLNTLSETVTSAPFTLPTTTTTTTTTMPPSSTTTTTTLAP
jgi:hypothetical protein